MKRYILCLLLICFSVSLAAQGDLSANSLFRKYKRNTDMRGATIPGFLIKMGSWFVDADEDPELKQMLSKVGGIRFLVSEGSDQKQNEFLNEMSHTLSPEYEELMTIKDGEDNFIIRIKENKGNVQELVMLGQSDEDAMYIVVHGNFPIEEIGTLVHGITEGDFID